MCWKARWKGEDVPVHKFDSINVTDYHLNDWFTRFTYCLVYIWLIKSLIVYSLDIFTAITMLSSGKWVNAIYAKCGDDCFIDVNFDIVKWVFVGCIIASFVLLGYEWYRARKVIRSNDIALTYTNVIANDYYSLKDYHYYCFWCHLSESSKKKDILIGFVFWTFKGESARDGFCGNPGKTTRVPPC